MTEDVCCFTGHRPAKLNELFFSSSGYLDELRYQIKRSIEDMIARGVSTFITGMAMGTDIWCAQIVLDLKDVYPDIKLYALVPHRNQAVKWPKEWQDCFDDILLRCDEMIILHQKYVVGCMQQRDRVMVDMSGHVIAVYDGTPGGTQYTVEYAKKKGLDIVVIDPGSVFLSMDDIRNAQTEKK